MAIFLRLDDRLIHGQIVTAWSRQLQVRTLMVANDAVAKDELSRAALAMTAPAGMKVVIKTVDETIRLLSDPRAEKMRILLLVDNPRDALTLVKTLGLKEVNVANFNKKKAPNKIQITHQCRATPEDIAVFRELAAATETLYTQMLPTTERLNFKEILEKIDG